MVLTVMTVVVCLLFPLISIYALVPYLEGVFNGVAEGLLSSSNMIIMVIMLAVMVLLAALYFGKSKKQQVPIYLAGVNTGDNRTYYGSMQKEVGFSTRNWYMENYFGEHRMNVIGDVLNVVMLVLGIGFMVAELISLLGGVA